MNSTDDVEKIRAYIAQHTPDNPCLKGFKVFSQNEEDGVIEDILERVGRVSPPNHKFLEIGCGDGLENNTHYLLLKGYHGYWVDASPQKIQFIRDQLGGLEFPSLLVRHLFVNTISAGRLIEDVVAFLKTDEPDFFSLDIDGNDLWVLREALQYFRPKVLCVEYNAKFPPPLDISVAYDPNYHWAGDDYQGASIQAFRSCLVPYHYMLVSCAISGVNAFFVREDLAVNFREYATPLLYQPFRERLCKQKVFFPPSLKWLRDKLR